MAWLTKEEARTLWRDAPADDTTLTAYLDAARVAVLAYAPTPEGVDYTAENWTENPEGSGLFEWGTANPFPADEVPEHWRLAQAMQARNIWNAGKAAPGGDFDGSGYGLSSYPLDWQVKQLLRPQRGVGAIV